jgi:hypothetical protein
MNHNITTTTTTTTPPDLRNKTKAELEDIVNNYTKKYGPPDESQYDGANNTLFGWPEDGKGVWVLPTTKANFERFEEIARLRTDLGHDTRAHCEIMRLAGAQYFADWRDSDRARAVKEEESQRAIEEEDGSSK